MPGKKSPGRPRATEKENTQRITIWSVPIENVQALKNIAENKGYSGIAGYLRVKIMEIIDAAPLKDKISRKED